MEARSLLVALLISAVLGSTSCSDDDSGAGLGDGCSTDSDCSHGLYCSPDGSLEGVCTAACSSDAECREEFGSNANCVVSNTVCAMECNYDSDCNGASCVLFTSGSSFCTNS